MILRRRIRQLLEDRTIDAINANPNASKEEIEQEVRASLEDDFGASPFWELILKYLPEIIAFLMALLKKPA